MFRVSKDIKHIEGVIAIMPRDDLVSNVVAVESMIRVVEPLHTRRRGGIIVMVNVRGMSALEIDGGHIELEIVRQVWVSEGANTMGWVVWPRYPRVRRERIVIR